ncbi:hypothetical protein E2C01_014639 [Portunus trituberculatus]|uniref:Uncharacterized protein n=1 Tax=Portunus trituberculatus TaxID=210409 RepID=A0A5B7DKM3_PORTR|nr:hypothetical protein [Portunus trituberculatus]
MSIVSSGGVRLLAGPGCGRPGKTVSPAACSNSARNKGGRHWESGVAVSVCHRGLPTPGLALPPPHEGSSSLAQNAQASGMQVATSCGGGGREKGGKEKRGMKDRRVCSLIFSIIRPLLGRRRPYTFANCVGSVHTPRPDGTGSGKLSVELLHVSAFRGPQTCDVLYEGNGASREAASVTPDPALLLRRA